MLFSNVEVIHQQDLVGFCGMRKFENMQFVELPHSAKYTYRRL